MNRIARRIALAALVPVALTGFGQVDATAAPTQDHPQAVRPHDLLTRFSVASAYETQRPVSRSAGRGGSAYALSACTGETNLRDVVGRGGRILHAELHGRYGDRDRRFGVVEQAVGRPGARKAGATYRTILHLVSECRHQPAGHWHYGPRHLVLSDFGVATWMASIDGDGSRSGGYVVVRTGNRVAVVEALAGGPRQVLQLAGSALQRLR